MPDEAEDAVCSGCQTKLTRRYKCGACRYVFYCSAACQLAHWVKGHKKDCKVKARVKFLKLTMEIHKQEEGKGPGLTVEQAEDLVGLTWGQKDEFGPEGHLDALIELGQVARKRRHAESDGAAYIKLMIRGLRAYPITPDLKPNELMSRLVVMRCMYHLSPEDNGKMDHAAFVVVIGNARVVEDTLRFRGYASLAYVLHAGFLARKASTVEAREEMLATGQRCRSLGTGGSEHAFTVP